MAPAASLTVTTTGDLVDDVYNAFSIRFASLANRRPVWIVNFTVDQFSFFVGALGGIWMGYYLNQYDLPNINNIEYYNNESEVRNGNMFMDIVNHIVSNPVRVIQRFFFSGTLYVLIGLATGRILNQDGWLRPVVCGGLTGFYFTYFGTSFTHSFTKNVEGVLGFAAFSLLMETAFGFVVG